MPSNPVFGTLAIIATFTLLLSAGCSNINNSSLVESSFPALKFGECYIENCSKCASYNLPFTCQKCKEGMSCCPDHCYKCSESDPTACEVCQGGFAYNETTKNCYVVNECSQTGCIFCDDMRNRCMGCFPGWVMNPFTRLCTQCIKYCETCVLPHTCTSCRQGTIFLDEQCQRCDENCETCKGSVTNCTTCRSGYFKDKNNTCQSCRNIEMCLQCNSASNCIKCQPHYYIENGACRICLEQCVSCQDNSSCTKCQSNHIMNETSHRCQLCFQYIPGCFKCSGKDDSYQLKLFETSDHLILLDNSTTICKACAEGYFKIDDYHCGKCIENCQICNTTENCWRCQNPFTINTQTQKCEKCKIPDCLICTNTQVCLVCIDGHYWDSYTSDYPHCRQCPSGCQSCMPNQCTSCFAGHYLKDGFCYKCNPQCQYCEDSGPTDCTTCSFGYYASTSSRKLCIQCHFPCVSCETHDHCKSCIHGYRLSNDYRCIKCQSDNCSMCRLDNHTIALPAGLEQNQQNPLVYQETEKCLYCDESFFLNQNGECQKCLQNCFHCTNSTLCLECEKEYIYSLNRSVCLKCPDNCRKCMWTTNDELSCESCEQGYNIDDANRKSCVPCPKHCTECSAGLCGQCQIGYYNHHFKQCLPCDPKCLTCNFFDQCDKCIDGFYLTANRKCVPCPQGCELCTQNGMCLKCGPTYYLSHNHDCQKCSIKYCSICSANSPNECQRCLETYNSEFEQVPGGHSKSATAATIKNCYKCGEGLLLGCQSCSSSNSCTACISDYQLNEKNLCEAISMQNDNSGLIITVVCLSLALILVTVFVGIKSNKDSKKFKKYRQSHQTQDKIQIIDSDGRQIQSSNEYSLQEFSHNKNHEEYVKIN